MSLERRARSGRQRASARTGYLGASTWLLCAALACASQPPPAAEAPPEGSAEASAAAPPPAPAPPVTEPASPQAAGSASATPSAAPSSEFDQDIANIEKMAGLRPADGSAPSGRDIVYRVSSGELTVELGGLTLKPKAKAVKRDNGSYGVELEVVAESKDGQQYWISSPSDRPLSIAGELLVRSDETQRFADERKGAGELLVPAGSTRRFRQSWPAKGQPKLWGGQKATLEVGLWGVHGDDERERPVKRLFIIKLSASARPTALIMPPDVVGSE
jgi:hypothetical protein